MFEIIIGIIAGLILIGGIWSYFVTKKAKNEGIATEAVVSRIEFHEWESGTGEIWAAGDVTWEPYVTYTNQEGQTVEAMLSNPGEGLKVGSRVIIKYLPDKQEYPVLVEIL